MGEPLEKVSIAHDSAVLCFVLLLFESFLSSRVLVTFSDLAIRGFELVLSGCPAKEMRPTSIVHMWLGGSI